MYTEESSLPVKIGHYSSEMSGLTVFLLPKQAHCGAWMCGSAPATREWGLLDPVNSIDTINALLFAGGSAFGLDSAQGVMQWLKEQNKGIVTPGGVVPIVPTACIYDLQPSPNYRVPTAQDAYHACLTASYQSSPMGCIGVGTGARINKIEPSKVRSGGFGYSHLKGPKGLLVHTYVVVNAAGNVLTEDVSNHNHDRELPEISINQIDQFLRGQNTVLVAIFTNAMLSKSGLCRIGKMASAGIAKAIEPAFTPIDGDVIYCCSLGNLKIDELIIGWLAARGTQQAITHATQSRDRHFHPCHDLKTS